MEISTNECQTVIVSNEDAAHDSDFSEKSEELTSSLDFASGNVSS
jgi:hypothetical protein